MLNSFQDAHNEHGKSQKVIADAIGCTTSTLYKWANGLRCVPRHRRKSVDRAFGCDVDWAAYDLECAAQRAHLKPVPQKDATDTPAQPQGGRWGAPTAPQPAPTPDTPPERPTDAFSALYGDL